MKFNIVKTNDYYGDGFDVAISEDEKYIIFPFLKSWCFTTMSNYVIWK